jgi:hypothetical protein
MRSLNFLVNQIAYWNTLHLDAVLSHLEGSGRFTLSDAEIDHLTPLLHGHITPFGRYAGFGAS